MNFFLYSLLLTPFLLLGMCIYFFLSGNLTMPERPMETEQQYCARFANSATRGVPAKCLKYFIPATP